MYYGETNLGLFSKHWGGNTIGRTVSPKANYLRPPPLHAQTDAHTHAIT